MPAPAFTLSVPADDSFRGLVADAVRVFLRASGGGLSPDDEAFAASVNVAAGRVSGGGDNIDVVVLAAPARVDVQLTCGTVSETLTHTPAAAGG